MPFTSEDISRTPDQASYKLNMLQSSLQNVWSAIYPVGSFYRTSDSDFDPNKSWGGEWEKASNDTWHRIA